MFYIKMIKYTKDKIIKKTKVNINNKLLNGTQYLLNNDLLIKQIFKFSINKKHVIKYNINIIKQIKPLSLVILSYKYICKNLFY